MKVQQDFKGKFKYWDKLCNFLAVVRAIELKLDKVFTLQQTLDCLKDLIACNQITLKGSLNSGGSYLAMAKYLGSLAGQPNLKLYQVGFLDDEDRPVTWDGKVANYDFVQLKWITGLDNQHWTLGDKKAKEIFDAWDGPIEKVELAKRYLLEVRE